MFIYEKNKLNKETGEVEQSLNVTFEGNKPVETPDVVITKDGVTGIKSDSNAYTFSFNNFAISYYSSISIDGEVYTFTEEFDASPVVNVSFNRYVGYNVTTNPSAEGFCVQYIRDGSIYRDFIYLDDTLFTKVTTNEVGEYIIDTDNMTIHTPSRDYTVSDFSPNTQSIFKQYKVIGFMLI